MRRPDVDAMLAEISAEQFIEWGAFERIEPFGELRADLRAGKIAAAIVNANPWRPKGARAAVPADFFLSLDAARPRQTPEQMKDIMKRWAVASGGKID
jgi:hypothetical protein